MIYMVVTYSDYVHYVLWVGELTRCKFQNGVDFGSFKRKFVFLGNFGWLNLLEVYFGE